jgi:phosphate transport system protein
MRAAFHAELDELLTGLARMVRLVGQMMINASIALHQTDLALAELVIAQREQLKGTLKDADQRCVALLALQAPVAGDLRAVIAALHVVGHVHRMASLARDVAIVALLKNPSPMASGRVRPVLARMCLLASELAEDAAAAIEQRDPLSGCRLAVVDDEVDALLWHLCGILFAENWSDGVDQAVGAALVGHYCERFGHHAVAIAWQVCYVTTGRTLGLAASGMARARPSTRHNDGTPWESARQGAVTNGGS